MRVFLIVSLLAAATPAAAQATARCADTTLHFEFQVDQPARWLVDTSLAAHPVAYTPQAANVIQFFLDTAGVPEPRTFRALKRSDPMLVFAVQRSYTEWRYAPAVLRGCHVRQLISTSIERSSRATPPF